MSLAAALDLWVSYNRRVLVAVPADKRIVTHYERYFLDAPAELGRVLRSLGMAASRDVLDRACASIDSSLSHHWMGMDTQTEEAIPVEVLECYRSLCAEVVLLPELSAT